MPSSAPEPIGSPKTITPPRIAAQLDATEAVAITGIASPSCIPRASAKKAPMPPTTASSSPGAHDRDRAPGADRLGERLDRDVGDADQQAGGEPEDDAVTDRAAAQHAGGEQGAAGADQHRLEAGERGDRVALVLARVRDGDGQEREPGGGEAEAEPLAAVEPVTEVALGREGDQHQAPGDHGLDQRQRGDRHRGDVEHPGDRGDREAHRPPSGAKQGREAPQGAPEPDRQAPRRRRDA